MIMNNNVKEKLKQITKHIKFLNPKWIIMDQLYSKSKCTIVLVTFLSDSIIEKCIENLGNKREIIIIENSNRQKFKIKFKKN